LVGWNVARGATTPPPEPLAGHDVAA
jgi:hypothetical protein